MSIAFSCSCGKRLVAKDEFAGKRLKCPQCQKVVVIPAPTTPEFSSPTLEDAPVKRPPLAEVAPPEAEVPLARPAVAAPPVLEETVPLARPVLKPTPPARSWRDERDEPVGKPAAVPPAKPVVAAVHPWVDRSLDQKATPWRGDDEARLNQGMEERQRSRFWPAVLVLLLLGGAAGGAWYLLPAETRPGRDPSDLELVPPNATGFVSLRVADLWSRPHAQPVRAALVQDETKPEVMIRRRFGVSPDEIERITVVLVDLPDLRNSLRRPLGGPVMRKGGKGKKAGPAQPKGQTTQPAPIFAPNAGQFARDTNFMVLVATRKPYSEDQVFLALASGGEPVLHRGRYYYRFQTFGREAALYFVHKKLFLVASVPAMEDFLDREPAGHSSGPLDSALKLTDQKHLVLGFNVPEHVRKTAEALAAQVPNDAMPFLDLRGGAVAVNDGDKAFDLDIHLRFSDAAKAEAAAGSLRGYVKQAQESLSKQIATQPQEAQAALKKLEEAVQRITVNTTGSEVLILGNIDAAVLNTMKSSAAAEPLR